MSNLRIDVVVGTRLHPGAKLRVPMPPKSTVADLAARLATRAPLPDAAQEYRLLTSTDALLAPEDLLIDVLDPSDIVFATPTLKKTINSLSADSIPAPGAPGTNNPLKRSAAEELEDTRPARQSPRQSRILTDPDGKNIKISLLTPERARKGLAPVPLFRGEAVSVHTLMGEVRREAVEELGWATGINLLDPNTDEVEQEVDGSCSCATASVVSTCGGFEHLHCPREVDGSACMLADCKYSHARINSGIIGTTGPANLECKICSELLGFPCPACIGQATIAANATGQEVQPRGIKFCPLVQNAGCKHLFHAHCYFKNKSLTGCPAGCARANFPFESVPFLPDSESKPHIVVIHSGSEIERIPLPQELSNANGDLITLTDGQIIEILFPRYRRHCEMRVRMFGRNRDGLVTFRHSTIVAVCCASRHQVVDGIVRQTILGSESPKEPGFSTSIRNVRSVKDLLDLHTGASPIFNVSSQATIEGLGLDLRVNANGELVLYAVRRARLLKDQKRGVLGKGALYSVSPEWHPEVEQTQRGISAFLSSLLVFAHHLATCDDNKKQQARMLTYLTALTRFPPAIRTLYLLIKNDTPQPEERRAFVEVMYQLAQELVPIEVTKGNASRTFEGARLLFGMLLHSARGSFTLPGVNVPSQVTELITEVPLTCALTGEPLRSPVVESNHGQIVESGAAAARQVGAYLYDPSEPPTGTTDVSADFKSLMTCAARVVDTLVVSNSQFTPPELLANNLSIDFRYAIDMTNRTDLKIHAPLNLKQRVVTPALTLDEAGLNTVYLTRAGACGVQDTIFLRPCHGGEVEADVNVVAARLEPIIVQRKLLQEWAVDAFSGAGGDQVDTREVDEAIVVALDLSQSMTENFHEDEWDSDSDDDGDVDTLDETMVQKAIERYNGRPETHPNAMANAKSWIDGLSYLRNMGRYILRPAESEVRKERSVSVLDELKIVYAREHAELTKHFYRPRDPTDRIKNLEDFIALINEDTSRDELADHLLEKVVAAKEFEKSEPNGNQVTVPRRFLCPLSGEIMHNPEKYEDGWSYERSNITSWLNKPGVNGRSPMDPRRHLGIPEQNTQLKRDIMQWLSGRNRSGYPLPLGRPVLVEMSGSGSPVSFITISGRDVTGISLMFDVWYLRGVRPSKQSLLHGVHEMGDGKKTGFWLGNNDTMGRIKHELTQFGVTSPPGPLVNQMPIWVNGYHVPKSAESKARRASRHLSRLDVVKQAFEALLNKIQAFDLPVALGLVTFGKEVKIRQELTVNKENFRTQLRDVEAGGDTPLYDCLSMAHGMLQSYSAQHPNARLRILCLTDGNDVGSSAEAHLVCAKLQRAKIKLDGMNLLGDERSLLNAMAIATGGYSFYVETLENALAIAELETVLSSKDRMPRPPKAVVRSSTALSYWIMSAYDEVTASSFPARKPHERLQQPVVQASTCLTKAPVPSTDRLRRLMAELRACTINPHPAIDLYASEEDMGFWKIVIEAPEGSPYQGGTFMAYASFPEDFPRSPPEIRFQTKIIHVNINRHGKVCHSALDRSWVASMSMSTILSLVYGLLLTPDTDNPLDLHATLEYNDDTGEHALKIHEMVEEFASKTREEWKEELDPTPHMDNNDMQS